MNILNLFDTIEIFHQCKSRTINSTINNPHYCKAINVRIDKLKRQAIKPTIRKLIGTQLNGKMILIHKRMSGKIEQTFYSYVQILLLCNNLQVKYIRKTKFVIFVKKKLRRTGINFYKDALIHLL